MGWVEEVLGHAPRVAVFDCDGTLWAADSGSGFMRWSLAQGLVSLGRKAWLEDRYEAYLAGAVDELAICREMVQVYAGLREEAIREAVRAYFAGETAPVIFTEMARLVRELRHAGVEMWAVSSTCDWVVEAGVVERFGIPAHRILAARVRVVGGIATDELLAVPTGDAKAAVLRQHGVTKPDAVFGNSVHDAAMLRMARFPYPVNPSPELLVEAEAARWPVFQPRSS